MIIFKDNKISVEDPISIRLDGVYYAIVINSITYNTFTARCYIYIPEVYGPSKNIYNRACDYPCVDIPIKQDDDDPGHIPLTGELVKVSFDDGNVNSCRFNFLIPIGEEQRLRNENYIKKGIISADIIDDIEDPDLLNKILPLVNYAYYISIGKYQPDENSFTIKLLTSNGHFNNYFLEPLIMPLTAQYTRSGNEGLDGFPPLFSSIIYLLSDVMQSLIESCYDELLNIFNNPPKTRILDSAINYDPDSAFSDSTTNQNDDKVYAISSLISGVATPFTQILFPNASQSVLDWRDGNAYYAFYSLYRAYEADYIQGLGNNHYSNFLFNHKDIYEKEWAQTIVSWLTGINAIAGEASVDLKIMIAFCLNLCPWMATTLIGYDENYFDIQRNANVILQQQYQELYNHYNIEERSYNSLFDSDQKFVEASETLNSAILENDVDNFIDVFQNLARECFRDLQGIYGFTWDYCDMDSKFNRLKSIKQDIINAYNNT